MQAVFEFRVPKIKVIRDGFTLLAKWEHSTERPTRTPINSNFQVSVAIVQVICGSAVLFMAANPSTGSEQSAKVPLTILSTIQPFTARDVLQTSVDRWHGRFTASHDESAETLTALNAAGFDLLDTFGVLSSIPITNPKLVSILRQ